MSINGIRSYLRQLIQGPKRATARRQSSPRLPIQHLEQLELRVLPAAAFGPIQEAADEVQTGAPDSLGTDFWLSFPMNYTGDNTLTLFIAGDSETSGTVAIPGLSFSTTFTVSPGTVTSVSIPIEALLTGSDSIENKGIHVTSSDEVSVYGLNRQQATTDAYLGLPTDILGTEYIVLSYVNALEYGGEFSIVATEDDTSIDITPTADNATSTRLAGQTFTITLNQGQTYQFQTAGVGVDITGTVITANRPIAVFGAHQIADVPVTATAADHLVEQLPPISTWGQSFVTVPLKTRIGGDTFRILASNDGTHVSINGTELAVLDQGEFYEQIIDGPSQITADQPILVAQYSNGSSFDSVTSDPFMMLVPPFEQFLGKYTVTTPTTGFSQNFINIAAPSSAVGFLTLDGVTISSDDFTAIGTSGFSYAQISVELGSHVIADSRTAGKGSPFGVSVYGFDYYDSYGYPGGISLAPIASVTELQLTATSPTVATGETATVTAIVMDQNDDPLEGIRVDFVVAGANVASGFVLTDADGKAVFSYTATLSGADTVTATVGQLTDSTVIQVGDADLSIEVTSVTGVYHLGKLRAFVDPSATLISSDPTPDFSNAKLTVSITVNRDAKDVLSIFPDAGKSGRIKVRGGKVYFNKVAIGKVSGGTKSSPDLVIEFNSSATRNGVDAVLKHINFRSSNTTVPQPDRTVKMKLTNVGGIDSNDATRVITVVAPAKKGSKNPT